MKVLQPSLIIKKFILCLVPYLLVVFAASQVNADLSIDEMIKKAEQGDMNAQFCLAVMYYKGEGVPQNFINSYAWFKLAASHGDEDAAKNIDEVASLLTPEQLAKAHELSAMLEQKPVNSSGVSSQQSSAAQSEDIKQIAKQEEVDAKLQLEPTDDEDSIWGTPFQFAIWNPVQLFSEKWNVYGLRANIFYGKNPDVYGLDLGLLANRANNFTGIQIAGAMNRVTETVRGVQIVGFANNVFNADITGIQIGFGNAAKNLTGIQFGCCAEATDSSAGIQFGGIFTKADNLKGLQIGCVNVTEKGFGVQLGIGNISTSMSGLQIGLINVMANGFLPVFPIINFSVAGEENAPPTENADTSEESDVPKESESP